MKPLILTLNLMCGADAASSHYALTHGAYEQILSQRPVVTDAVIAGQSVAVSVGLWHLSKQHPKAARIVGWSFVAVRGVIVAHNLQQIQRLR